MDFKYNKTAQELDDDLTSSTLDTGDVVEAEATKDEGNGILRIAEKKASLDVETQDPAEVLHRHTLVTELQKRASGTRNTITGFLKLTKESGDRHGC